MSGGRVVQDQGDQFAAGRQHAVEDRAGRRLHVRADDGHVPVDEAQHVALLADARRGPGLAFGDRDLGVAGGARGRGHRDDVLVEAAVRLVHGERGDALHRGTGRDEGDPDALGTGLLGRRGGRVPQLGVVGQQHDLARVGASYGLHQLPSGGRLPGASEDGGGARLAVQRGQALAGHHGHDGPLDALADGACGVGVPGAEVRDADPVRPSRLDAGLDGGARVVDVDVHVPQTVAAHDHQGVPQGVQALPQPCHGGVLGLQQVDHFERGSALFAVRAGRRVFHARVRVRGGRSGRLPRERLHQRRQHRHEPPPARVHDPGAFQRGQLPGRGGEGGAGAFVGGAGHGPAVAVGPVGGLGGGGGDGQDGPLDGMGDGLPGGVGGAAQGEAQGPPVGGGRCRRGPGPCPAGAGRGSSRSCRGHRSARRGPWPGRRR
ncbi:hypothetical protein GCM10020256_20540 [Streptomyces thermocoprophilus]